jgi:hypothetical protein
MSRRIVAGERGLEVGTRRVESPDVERRRALSVVRLHVEKRVALLLRGVLEELLAERPRFAELRPSRSLPLRILGSP